MYPLALECVKPAKDGAGRGPRELPSAAIRSITQAPLLLVIDNYDSFTFNLVQLLAQAGARVEVRRNDALDLGAIRSLDPEGILLSPGPGRPEGAGVCLELVDALGSGLPMLGVCLGHQVLGQAFGGAVVSARRLMHGRTSEVRHDGEGVFRGLPSPFVATRYHSLLVEASSLPACLEATAWADDDELMGLRHRELPLEGVQFHPESFLTERGAALLQNFLRTLPEEGRR